MQWLIDQEKLGDKIQLDSSGTGDWHVGQKADPRTRAAAKARGIDVVSIARHATSDDFAKFDYVIAMDRSNRENLLRMAPDDAARAKVHLLRDFDPQSPKDSEVPDPYYGGEDGFNEVLDICDAGCRGLLAHIRATHGI